MIIYGLIENAYFRHELVGKPLKLGDRVVGVILGCEVFSKDNKFLKYRALVADDHTEHEISIGNLKYINNGLTITAKKEDTKNV